LETAVGERRSVTIHPVSSPDPADLRLATEHPPLWLQRLGEPWWTEVLPDSQTVYLAFRRYPPERDFRERSAALGRLLDESGARRVIIDLRLNGGGDFTLGRRFLLPVIQDRPTIDRPGGVYVITGPGTFSAAMVNARDLRHEANAVLVGEPTGARPNSYSEHGDLTLANSGLQVSYSTRYYQFGADADSAVVPDEHIEPTWEDFRAGKDPVIDWILQQPIP
jgi:C-terminal processing protease CtpA/Prc